MVTAYPVAGKQKSFDICVAFAKSCGGRVSTELRAGPAAFYGVDGSNVAIWKEVVRSGRDYFYVDNSYFDVARERQFRITKNALQHSGRGTSDGTRFRALGVPIEPWRTGGHHVLLVPQSEHFMRTVVGAEADWMVPTIHALEALTKRPLLTRAWDRNKGKLAMTLRDDLMDAHAVVTWSSAAAITAVLAGVPVITLGQCAAEPMSGSLQQIESLPRPEREEWAGVLADQQWTLDEIRNGTAWQALSSQH